MNREDALATSSILEEWCGVAQRRVSCFARATLGRRENRRVSAWVRRVSRSQIAKCGGVVRRKITSIDKFASWVDVKAECTKHGHDILRNFLGGDT